GRLARRAIDERTERLRRCLVVQVVYPLCPSARRAEEAGARDGEGERPLEPTPRRRARRVHQESHTYQLQQRSGGTQARLAARGGALTCNSGRTRPGRVTSANHGKPKR